MTYLQLRAYTARKLCRSLPPSLAYRVQFAWFNDLLGIDLSFSERTLFGSGRISGTMSDAMEAVFALHGTANLEGMVVAAYCLKPGDTVYEFGANVGTETLALAGLVGQRGKVVAVEADPSNARLLSQRITENKLSQIVLIPKAVSDSCEPLYLHRSHSSNSGMSFVTAFKAETQEEVPSVTPDGILSEHGSPKLILMDLEGAEYRALQGSFTILQRFRPVIVCEVDSGFLGRLGNNPQGLFELLANNRYRLYALNNPRMPEITQRDLGGKLHGDWLGLPEENADADSRLIRRALFRARWLPKVKHLSPLWC